MFKFRLTVSNGSNGILFLIISSVIQYPQLLHFAGILQSVLLFCYHVMHNNSHIYQIMLSLNSIQTNACTFLCRVEIFEFFRHIIKLTSSTIFDMIYIRQSCYQLALIAAWEETGGSPSAFHKHLYATTSSASCQFPPGKGSSVHGIF